MQAKYGRCEGWDWLAHDWGGGCFVRELFGLIERAQIHTTPAHENTTGTSPHTQATPSTHRGRRRGGCTRRGSRTRYKRWRGGGYAQRSYDGVEAQLGATRHEAVHIARDDVLALLQQRLAAAQRYVRPRQVRTRHCGSGTCGDKDGGLREVAPAHLHRVDVASGAVDKAYKHLDARRRNFIELHVDRRPEERCDVFF